MFTKNEITTIETWRGINNKSAFHKLRDIYTKYTGITVKGCGCKSQERQAFLTMFYDWYDQEAD